jgi:hypothetical protein
LGVFELAFDGEILSERFSEPALKLVATRGQRFNLFHQSFDLDINILQ